MSDFTAIKIGSAGMSVQSQRIRVISENLANIHTTGPDGPYQRKNTVIQSQPLSAFDKTFADALGEVLTEEEIQAIQTVAVREISGDGSDPVLQYDPSHPHADPDTGYVALPNISVIREMADLTEATRSYEANLAVVKTAGDMIRAAMDHLA